MGYRQVLLRVGVALGLVLFGGEALADGNLPVQTLHLDRKSANYEIAILYPRTGNAAIDARVAEWAEQHADQFAADSAGKGPDESPYSLDVSYTVTRNDSEMFETLFEYDSYTGGAHPNHELFTLNFMLPDGAQVYLPEIVGLDGIKRVSELARKNLIDELTKGSDPSSNEDMVRMGTEPQADDFDIFTITKSELILYFSDYQVAPYASGPQMTRIPLSKLRGVVRRNWRTPQPSFDCDSALTPIEKAICSDTALARLDLQVAEAYAWKVNLAANDAEKARAREEQRAFIAQRDTTCAAEADAALTQCLANAYRERAKVLKAPLL